MSDDQHKQPESASSEPQIPPTPSSVSQSGTRLKTTSRTTKPTGNLVQRLVKAQSIKVLQGTIALLEGIVEKLEAEPVSKLSPTVSLPTQTPVSTSVFDTLTATPEPSVSSVVEPVVSTPVSDTPTVTPKAVTQQQAVDQVSQPTKPKLLDRLLPSFNRLQSFWDATLVKVRSFLPPAWNEKLSDWGLTGAIAGIVVVLLLTTVALLPETPAQFAKTLPDPIEAPPKLTAPNEPQPLEAVPPPIPELTPEQNLIAAIQNQVAEITDQYGTGLIKSIQANFPGSRLVVKVSDGWYSLTESQQNKIADDILLRSKELDFRKLEITDLEGTLLARSPVVGANMVILKRQQVAVN